MIADRTTREDFQFIHTHKQDVLLAQQLPWMHSGRSTEENFPPIGNDPNEISQYAFPKLEIVMSQSGYPVNVFARDGAIYAYRDRVPNSALITDKTGIIIPSNLQYMPTRVTYENGPIASLQWVPIVDEKHPSVMGLCCIHSDSDHKSSVGLALFQEQEQDKNVLFAIPMMFNIQTIHGGKIDTLNPLAALAPVIIAADTRLHGLGWDNFIQSHITDAASRIVATSEGIIMSLTDDRQHGFSTAFMIQKDESYAMLTVSTKKDEKFNIIIEQSGP